MKILIDSSLEFELITTAHLDDLMKAVAANRAYLREWLTWPDHMKTEAEFLSYLEGAEERNGNGSDFSGIIREDERFVGRIGLYNIDVPNRSAVIGYWIVEEAQGRGIVSRCCEELLRYAFINLQLNRIEIRCATANTSSLAIPKRLGFQREGIVRQGEWLNGVFVDQYLYSMLREEWEASRK